MPFQIPIITKSFKIVRERGVSGFFSAVKWKIRSYNVIFKDVYLPAAELVLVAGGEYSFIKIQNTSSTDTANTLLMAAD